MEACHVCRRVQLVLAVPIKRKITSQKGRVQLSTTTSDLPLTSNAGPARGASRLFCSAFLSRQGVCSSTMAP